MSAPKKSGDKKTTASKSVAAPKELAKVCNNECCKKGNVWIANMGHGETIVFKKGDEYYLRDFGESSGSRETGCTVMRMLGDEPTDECKNCCMINDCIFRKIPNGSDMRRGLQWNAILSHAHGDHFKGFLEIFNQIRKKEESGFTVEKVFDKAFLPCFCSKKVNIKHFSSYVEAAAILYSFSNMTQVYHFKEISITNDERHCCRV